MKAMEQTCEGKAETGFISFAQETIPTAKRMKYTAPAFPHSSK